MTPEIGPQRHGPVPSQRREDAEPEVGGLVRKISKAPFLLISFHGPGGQGARAFSAGS